eukprot:1592375-Pleurochrysis_carterae.AAC.2
MAMPMAEGCDWYRRKGRYHLKQLCVHLPALKGRSQKSPQGSSFIPAGSPLTQPHSVRAHAPPPPEPQQACSP